MTDPPLRRRALLTLRGLGIALGVPAPAPPAPLRRPPRRPPSPPLPGAVRAAILPFDCLAHQGTACSACADRCPAPGALRVEAGRPVVDAARCTGCGECQLACPSPRRPIVLMPAAVRAGGAA